MKLEKPVNKKEWLLVFSGLFILPLFSLNLSSKASLFYENLTYVGNLTNNRHLFIIWGILQSVFYFASFYTLYHKLNLQKKHLISLSACLMSISIIAFLLPYSNHGGDILSQLHVYGSMFSCIGTYGMIVYVLTEQANYDFHYFISCRNLLFIILSIFAFCILLLGDISTLSELFLLDGLNLIFIYMILHTKDE